MCLCGINKKKKRKLTSVLTGDEIDVVSELGLVFGMAHEVLESKSLDDACGGLMKSVGNPRTGFPHRSCDEECGKP